MVADIIQHAAQVEKLNFGAGTAEELKEREIKFPLVWLEDSVITGSKGSVTDMRIVMNILDVPDNYVNGESVKYQVADRTLKLFENVVKSPYVIKYGGIKVATNRTPKTNYGEISVTATIEVSLAPEL